MKLTLHHINLSTDKVAEMDTFYRDVLGLERETSGLPTLEKGKGYAGDVAFVTDGHIQTHLAERDVLAGFKTGHIVNAGNHWNSIRCDVNHTCPTLDNLGLL